MLKLLVLFAFLYWGSWPACGEPRVSAQPLPWDFVGLAQADRCRIAVTRRRLTDRARCTLVIHEYGHLLGLEHSGAVGDVMYPVLQPSTYPLICRQQFPLAKSARPPPR